jgi:superoxide dismutase, Fe-Mn family
MFSLPDLPYPEDALAPHISSKTMKLHHSKHHKTYVDKLNELLADDPMADLPLEEVVKCSHGDAATSAIFNNAAQSWNHDFFWKSMAPQGGGAPAGAVKRLIDRKFGDAKAFNKAFTDAAAAHFGSGWVWLVLNGDALEIVTTHDADLPLVHGLVALVTCDLWEHAYYLDYQNRRPEFVGTFLDHLINWHFANANLAAANGAENA